MSAVMPKAAAFLQSREWRHNPYADEECGAVGVRESGWCPRIAHWEKLGRQAMCATHARIREEWDRADG